MRRPDLGISKIGSPTLRQLTVADDAFRLLLLLLFLGGSFPTLFFTLRPRFLLALLALLLALFLTLLLTLFLALLALHLGWTRRFRRTRTLHLTRLLLTRLLHTRTLYARLLNRTWALNLPRLLHRTRLLRCTRLLPLRPCLLLYLPRTFHWARLVLLRRSKPRTIRARRFPLHRRRLHRHLDLLWRRSRLTHSPPHLPELGRALHVIAPQTVFRPSIQRPSRISL